MLIDIVQLICAINEMLITGKNKLLQIQLKPVWQTAWTVQIVREWFQHRWTRKNYGI